MAGSSKQRRPGRSLIVFARAARQGGRPFFFITPYKCAQLDPGHDKSDFWASLISVESILGPDPRDHRAIQITAESETPFSGLRRGYGFAATTSFAERNRTPIPLPFPSPDSPDCLGPLVYRLSKRPRNFAMKRNMPPGWWKLETSGRYTFPSIEYCVPGLSIAPRSTRSSRSRD